jgi:hypothetical protein
MQKFRALQRVRDFGMELHRVEAARFVRHAGDRARVGRGHELEALGHLDDLVAVAHPDFQQAFAVRSARVLQAIQKFRVAARAHLGVAEFAQLAGSTLPPSCWAMVCMP